MDLNDIERQVLRKLLDGEHPSLAALREQLAECAVRKREETGVGFFAELEVPTEAPRAPVKGGSIRFGDVTAELQGLEYGAGFVLFIEDGQMQMLEGYTVDEPWPEDVRVVELKYTSEPRDLSALAGTA